MPDFREVFIATTDTVTGIGAPMTDTNADAIYYLKKRDRNKKLIVMVGNLEQARRLPGWDEKAEALANQFWPGATTLVLKSDIAVRMPNVKGLCELIEKIGTIYMTSANVSGEPTLTFEEAKSKFQEVTNFYYFGEGSGQASQIIKVETGERLR